MKQIKTIIERRDYPGEFDRRVNLALADGWRLIHRYVSEGSASGAGSMIFYPALIAELEKEVPNAR